MQVIFDAFALPTVLPRISFASPPPSPFLPVCSCQDNEPAVLTAVPVDGRFESIVLSRTAIDDHSLMTITKKCDLAKEVRRADKAEGAPWHRPTLERILPHVSDTQYAFIPL